MADTSLDCDSSHWVCLLGMGKGGGVANKAVTNCLQLSECIGDSTTDSQTCSHTTFATECYHKPRCLPKTQFRSPRRPFRTVEQVAIEQKLVSTACFRRSHRATCHSKNTLGTSTMCNSPSQVWLRNWSRSTKSQASGPVGTQQWTDDTSTFLASLV